MTGVIQSFTNVFPCERSNDIGKVIRFKTMYPNPVRHFVLYSLNDYKTHWS